METEEAFTRKMLPKLLNRILYIKNIDGKFLSIDECISLSKDLLALMYREKSAEDFSDNYTSEDRYFDEEYT